MYWYIQGFKKYAVFSGRSGRTEYWMFVLYDLLMLAAIAILEGLLTGAGKAGIAVTLYKLGSLLPFCAVYVRRLHDIGRSGWWIWVPVVNFVMCCFDSQAEESEYGSSPKLSESANIVNL